MIYFLVLLDMLFLRYPFLSQLMWSTQGQLFPVASGLQSIKFYNTIFSQSFSFPFSELSSRAPIDLASLQLDKVMKNYSDISYRFTVWTDKKKSLPPHILDFSNTLLYQESSLSVICLCFLHPGQEIALYRTKTNYCYIHFLSMHCNKQLKILFLETFAEVFKLYRATFSFYTTLA